MSGVSLTQDQTVLFFDMHNLLFRSIFIGVAQDPLDKNYTYTKFLILNGLMRNIQKFKPTKVIIASDARNYWRKNVYPEYKAQRKAAREKSKVNFDEFFQVYNKFMEDLQEAFQNFMFLKIDTCEADDIIAVLTKEKYKSSNVINISTDHDFYQLMKQKNYKQFDPIKKKIVEHINPERELVMKILIGDKSDNIPAVKPKCGPATAAKMIEEGLDVSIVNQSIQDNFDRNKALIDFDMIPEEIKTKIIREYESYIINTFNGSKVFNFFIKHRISFFIENMTEFSPSLKNVS